MLWISLLWVLPKNEIIKGDECDYWNANGLWNEGLHSGKHDRGKGPASALLKGAMPGYIKAIVVWIIHET